MCTLISAIISSIVLLIFYLFEDLTSLSTPLMVGTFAFFNSAIIRDGNGKALAVLCALKNISSAIIYPKSIFNHLIVDQISTSTHTGITLSRTTTHNNFSLKINDDLENSSLLFIEHVSPLLVNMLASYTHWFSAMVILCSSSKLMVRVIYN